MPIGVRSDRMNRQTRFVLRALAVGVIVVGAVVLVPPVLDGVGLLLRSIRHNWWLVVAVAGACWVLFVVGRKH